MSTHSIEEYLRHIVSRGATDLHLTGHIPPFMRIDDRLVPTEFPALSPDEVKEVCYKMLAPEQIEKFERWKELDFAFTVEGLARFRANYYMQQGCVGAALRMLPFKIVPFDQLGLPSTVMTDLCNKTKGLILVTGATGSGKTTTLASMIDHINTNRDFHIITIEDPVEYIHQSKKCVVHQREVGSDTQSFAQALKHVLRQDPDTILVGEMRDLETIEMALMVAETGHLVMATLHTNDAASTINRIVDVFPSHQQAQVRVQLSMELLGVVTQQLVPHASGKGRVLAYEILIANHAVRSMIREQKVHQIYSAIQTGQKEGMRTMNQSLYEHYAKQAITLDEALARSTDTDDLLRLMKR